jgi:hypothetical protein
MINTIRSEDKFYKMTAQKYKLRPVNDWHFEKRGVVPGFGDCNVLRNDNSPIRLHLPITPRGLDKLRIILAKRRASDASIYSESRDYWISAENNTLEFADNER